MFVLLIVIQVLGWSLLQCPLADWCVVPSLILFVIQSVYLMCAVHNIKQAVKQ